MRSILKNYLILKSRFCWTDIWCWWISWEDIPKFSLDESCRTNNQVDARCWVEDVLSGLSAWHHILLIWASDLMVLAFRWVDQMGNIHGRVESGNSTEETLLIGSHYVSFTNIYYLFVFLSLVNRIVTLGFPGWNRTRLWMLEGLMDRWALYLQSLL